MHPRPAPLPRATTTRDDTGRLGRRVIMLVCILLIFVAIMSPSRRFGVGEDDPIEPIGDGKALAPNAPVAALIVFEETYSHAAWTAATTLHAVEPRMEILSVRVPPNNDDAANVDVISITAADAIPWFLSRYEGRTVAVIVLRVSSSDLVAFYRPFGERVAELKSQSHTLFQCAPSMQNLSTAFFVVRSTEQSQRFWRLVRRSIFNPKTHEWINRRSLQDAVHVATRQLLRGKHQSMGDPRLGSVECLPHEVFVRSRNPSEGKPSLAPKQPAACISTIGEDKAEASHLPTDYQHQRLASFFSVVERECGTLEWEQTSATETAALRELREEQHLSRSPFTTIEATTILKGNVIAVQLPHTTDMPLARWATTTSLRAAEPNFRLYLVNPNSTTGRDPTPSASALADLLGEWQRVSPASSTFVWISGPAVAFGPFVDTLSLTLHSEAPAILIGTCENVQLVVAKNDPPYGATRWLRDCGVLTGGAIDHISVYVLGTPLNGTSRDDDGTFVVPAEESVVLQREPSDDARVCILDDPRYVKSLAARTDAELSANATQDIDAFIAAVGSRCGSPSAHRLQLGPWVQHDAVPSISRLVEKVVAASKTSRRSPSDVV